MGFNGPPKAKVVEKENSPLATEGGVETREKSGEAFRQTVEAGIREALDIIRDRFEHAENPLDNLAFHNTRHTEGVIERMKMILVALQAEERVALLGELVAAYHDIVQKYDVVDGMRKRNIGANEQESDAELFAYMQARQQVFSKEDVMIVNETIEEATTPDWNVTNKTVFQPNQSRYSGDIARALAFADLGTAGMEEPDAYIVDGNNLFREENIDIADALQNPDLLTDTQRESFTKRMLAWTSSQPSFAEGRKNLLDVELGSLPEEKAKAVKELFLHFDRNIRRAEQNVTHREKMSFEELAQDFGYKVPSLVSVG
ncbi:MAG: hypothetical protein WAW90_03570 [Minisyncoccia bacterium]